MTVHSLPNTQDSSTPEPPTPPHNLPAEAAVLGALLYDNNAFTRIADTIQASDFYAPAHNDIYAAIDLMIQGGRVADGVTLREYFEQRETLTRIGGARYLAQLLDSAAFGPEIVDYAKIIRELSIRRELLTIGTDVQSRARTPEAEQNGEQQIELAERALFNLAERGSTSQGFTNFGAAVTEALVIAEEAYKRDGKIAGVSTGLRDLDEKLGGLHGSDLIVLAGRPSMGKTALATNVAYNVAAACQRETQADGTKKSVKGGVVGFFSLEMSAEQLATRILAERTGISSHKIRQGDLDRADFDKFMDATQELQELPLHIDDTGGISISQLCARSRRLQRTFGLDLLIIDYIQLVTTSGNSNQNRVQEVTQITMTLKALAKELDIPIIALAQLSRQVEQREDKRPQLSDLRESGSIEQDADVVMFVFRESYYLERQEPQSSTDDINSADKWKRWRERLDEVYGTGEVIVGKQRHGPIGKVVLAFDANVTRFGDLDRHHGGDEM